MGGSLAIPALLAAVAILLVAVVVLSIRLRALRSRATQPPSSDAPGRPPTEPPTSPPPAPTPQLQRDVVQREKMAALGQLVAGVAHELNTPMGAINASASNLDAVVDRVLTDLPRTLEALDAETRAGFLELVRDILQTRFSAMSSRQERRLRRTLARQLADAGAAEADEVARLLAEMGCPDDLGPHLSLLVRPEARDLVPLANELVSLRRNTDTIRSASERAGKIVFALKSYAYPGGAKGTVFAGSLAENLDTVLTLYHNQIKGGLELVRRYDEAGRIVARHDELNQVWVNLVHNALQAMEGQGTLTVGVHDEPGDKVRVDIGDDGPGVPVEYLGRIFDPFFTTKTAGEGSGLGLAICRDIVAAHGGELSVQSSPGNTVFSVVLPRGSAVAPEP